MCVRVCVVCVCVCVCVSVCVCVCVRVWCVCAWLCFFFLLLLLLVVVAVVVLSFFLSFFLSSSLCTLLVNRCFWSFSSPSLLYRLFNWFRIFTLTLHLRTSLVCLHMFIMPKNLFVVVVYIYITKCISYATIH